MTLATASVLLGLSACSPSGYPKWNGYEIRALALPDHILYFGPGEPELDLIEHEMCHQRRMKEYGVARFYARYLFDQEFACQEERVCGVTGPHPSCY